MGELFAPGHLLVVLAIAILVFGPKKLPELVSLVLQYRRAAEELSAGISTAERTATPAWRTLTESAGLAGEIARATSTEADQLRVRFRQLTAARPLLDS